MSNFIVQKNINFLDHKKNLKKTFLTHVKANAFIDYKPAELRLNTRWIIVFYSKTLTDIMKRQRFFCACNKSAVGMFNTYRKWHLSIFRLKIFTFKKQSNNKCCQPILGNERTLYVKFAANNLPQKNRQVEQQDGFGNL